VNTAKDTQMATAQLQVVQPGSRGSFRRRAMDAMLSVVHAQGAFFCLGTEDARAYLDASRLVDGATVKLHAVRGERLTAAFGFEVKSVVTTTRRAYLDDELYPDEERQRLPFFRDNSTSPNFSRALLLFLHEGGVLFGLAGLERRAGESAFTRDDSERLEELAPFLVAGARAQIAFDERAREVVALRALGRVTGSLYVIDRDHRIVVWAADRQHGISWDDDVTPHEGALVDAAEQLIASRARGEALPTPPRLPIGTVVAAAKIDIDPVFGKSRCAVVRLDSPQDAGSHAPQLLEGLSKREREIARLLVAGYSGVNVAAIVGLSENTVRTYVRRLYQKLDVSNRADLVRKLVSPDPKSVSPSSQLSPPPDSSLVDGDETLD
jgi:DNA-binding CsgD family transcriptional regulator